MTHCKECGRSFEFPIYRIMLHQKMSIEEGKLALEPICPLCYAALNVISDALRRKAESGDDSETPTRDATGGGITR